MFAFFLRRSVLTVCLTCAALIGVARVVAEETGAPEQPTAAEWVAIPSGVADTEGKTAYVTGASDAVEAIDLATGHTLWETKHAHRPVALSGGKLIAIEPRGTQEPANTMGVAVLDVNSGQVLLSSQPIVFPEWIAVDGGIGLGFSSTVSLEGNTLKLHWHAWRQFVGGVPPSAEAIAAARKDQVGIAQVDLDTGHTDVQTDELAKPAKRPSLGRFTDVGNTRLMVTEREEKIPSGVQIIHRTLEASDKRTGRPLWQHEIASDLIVPANLPQQVQQQAQQQMQYDDRR